MPQDSFTVHDERLDELLTEGEVKRRAFLVLGVLRTGTRSGPNLTAWVTTSSPCMQSTWSRVRTKTLPGLMPVLSMRWLATLGWPTLTTAMKSAERGVSDSSDHVMRKALALLEREMLAEKLLRGSLRPG